jgi:hypothetical protein
MDLNPLEKTVTLGIVTEAQKRGGAAAFKQSEFDIMYNVS